jgi:hypothetical protein
MRTEVCVLIELIYLVSNPPPPPLKKKGWTAFLMHPADSISRYSPWHRHSSKIYYPFLNLPTVNLSTLPVVQLSEDSELLGTFVSMLYPLRPVIPNTYDKLLSLLPTHQW